MHQQYITSVVTKPAFLVVTHFSTKPTRNDATLQHKVDCFFLTIHELNDEIAEIEAEIKKIMDIINSPILSVPGIGLNLGALIIAEIGDFSRFSSPDKILAFAGCSTSTYQSGQLYSSHAKMEKRGSRYLRWALLNAAAYVCNWEPTFAAYLSKKRAEGKHYYVALSHAAKKLVRLLYHLETTGETYQLQKSS